MTTNIETIKAEYLSLFNASIPRLKELAIALRAGDGRTPQSGEFWDLTSDPKTNYELYQVAQDLSSLDEFWESIPENPQSSPNAQEGDRSESLHSNLKTNTGLLMDKLFKLEALLKLIEGSMSDREDSSAIRLAVELVENALDFTDTWIDRPISHL